MAGRRFAFWNSWWKEFWTVMLLPVRLTRIGMPVITGGEPALSANQPNWFAFDCC
jgi:hypothetical protein